MVLPLQRIWDAVVFVKISEVNDMGMATTLKLETSLPLQDAVDFMNTAYEQTKALFLLYERLPDVAQKHVIAEEFCVALKMNLEVEADVLLPALKSAGCDKSIVSAAAMTQSILSYLVEEISSLHKTSAVLHIKMKLLGAQLNDHVKNMRTRVFRHLSRCESLNLYRLRLQMESYRNRLIENLVA